MKILILSFFFIAQTWACDFHSDHKKVYSLSGLATQVIQELGLINSPRLQGISVFHPIPKNDFKGNYLGGGQFLSFAEISNWNAGLVFYDESRELGKILTQNKSIKSIEVKTRGKTPAESISDFLISNEDKFLGCDFLKLRTEFSKKMEHLKSLVPKNLKLIIFLGEITKQRFPEIVMVNDGVVKYLVDEKMMKTYPSSLSYPNWSARIMNDLQGYTKLGVIDSGSKLTKKIDKISDNTYNLTYPGAMIPGIGQVDALIYFFSSTNNLL